MILVTGGAGYIGSHFVRSYLAANPSGSVLVVDNLSLGHKESLRGLSQVVLKEEDIGNYDSMKSLLSQFHIETVVHFAASAYVGESQKDPNKYFHNNVINTVNLFRAMENAQVRKIVFSSTCASYGDPQYIPIDEQHPQDPISVYGLTKLIAEKILAAYISTSGWTYVALRYFNASGADENGVIGESHTPETHLIPLALQAALGGPELQIYGDDYDTPDGTCIRDYIHVTDLAMAHCQAIELLRTQKGGDAINLGTTTGASVKEIVGMCERVTGRQIPTRFVPRRAGDAPRLVADATKAKRILNWKPRYDLRQIVETAWHWEQDRKY